MWTCPKCGEPNEEQFDSCWRCAREGDNFGRSEVVEQSPSSWWRLGLIACEAYILAVPAALLLSMALAPSRAQWREWIQRQFEHQHGALFTGVECGYVICLVMLLLGALRFEWKVARQAYVFILLALLCLLVFHPFGHVMPAAGLSGTAGGCGTVMKG